MDLRGRLDRSGDLQTSLRSSVGGRSSISELDTRDLQDFLADDYVETYEGPPPRTPARAGSATEAWAGGGDGGAGGGGVVVLEPRRRVFTSTRAHARVDGAGRRLVNASSEVLLLLNSDLSFVVKVLWIKSRRSRGEPSSL